MKRFILIFLVICLIVNFAYRLDLERSSFALIGEMMYFPSGVAVKILSVGFHSLLADLIWLRFIQYYGEHRMTDARFDLMYHILDIMTTLDPYFLHPYNLGSLMLTHDAKRPDQAKRLIKKGIAVFPDEWRIYFMYGFIHYIFLGEYRIAQAYFRLAGQMPKAPDLPKRWAAFILQKKLKDLKTALALWIDLYNNTKDPEEAKIAKIHIDEIYMELTIEFLNKRVAEFTKKIERSPYHLGELIKVGLIDSIPAEPHNGIYYLKDGKVYSNWQTRK